MFLFLKGRNSFADLFSLGSLNDIRSFVDNLFKLTPEDLAKVVETLNERCESALDKVYCNGLYLLFLPPYRSSFHIILNRFPVMVIPGYKVYIT